MKLPFKSRGKSFEFEVALLKFQVPGLRFPVALRPGTSDVGTFTQTFVESNHELTLAKPPQFIIDGGANVGYVSALFANRYPGARILAVEPSAENFAILCENARPYPNIQAIQAAIWKHGGQVKLVTHDENNQPLAHWALRVTEASNPEQDTIRAVTIPELLESSGFPRVDILKMDIEGAEKEVFDDDAARWLEKTNILIIELHDRFQAGCTTAVFEAMRGLDFTQYKRAENTLFVRNVPIG